jgi:5-methyltetrahydrofolate--homocysteine methyltransferase
VKVVVGGAPVTQEYADEIGAQGYGSDANDAVNAVDRCLSLTA